MKIVKQKLINVDNESKRTKSNLHNTLGKTQSFSEKLPTVDKEVIDKSNKLRLSVY